MVLGTLVSQGQLERLHGLEDDAHGLDGVAEDDLLEGLALVPGVAALVDELHLLQDGRLAGLTSSCPEVSDVRRAHSQAREDVPSRSILISLRCNILSRLSWFSISSFLSFPSFSSVLIPQPILADYWGDTG